VTDSRVTQHQIEVITSSTDNETRMIYVAVELVTNVATNELRAETVLHSQDPSYSPEPPE